MQRVKFSEMKRIYSFIIIAALLLCGCTADNPPAQESMGYVFTDDTGREVNVSSHERTAALLGSFADVWMLSGGDICAAADDAWDDFNLTLSEDTVNLGGTKNLSLEALLASTPDFVLASTNTPQHLEWRDTLESAGITVAYFDVNCFDDYLRMLKICTDINKTPELYEKYGTALQSNISSILDEYGKTDESVLVLRASAASVRAKGSNKTVLGEILTDFGCTNIADSDETLLENLSVESIALFDPDRIFIIQSGDDIEGTKKNVENMFAENTLWAQLTAVKSGKVYYMDKHLYNLKPNARWDEAYRQLGDILYGKAD